jgi:hypothetical protein
MLSYRKAGNCCGACVIYGFRNMPVQEDFERIKKRAGSRSIGQYTKAYIYLASYQLKIHKEFIEKNKLKEIDKFINRNSGNAITVYSVDL